MSYCDDHEAANYPSEPRCGIRKTILTALVLMAVGSGLAVIWHNYGADMTKAGLLPSFQSAALKAKPSATPQQTAQPAAASQKTAQPAASARPEPAAEQKIQQLANDVAALRQGLDRIDATQRQMAQVLTALTANAQRPAPPQPDVTSSIGDRSALWDIGPR